MHSRIFQISTEPIDKENYLNEDTLQQGDGSFYDYCSEIDEEDRKEDIANLVNHALPKGMFELISDDTMRYNGGIEQWKEEYVANIKKRANALTADNMLEWGSTYYLKQAVENPLDVAYHLNGIPFAINSISALKISSSKTSNTSFITFKRFSSCPANFLSSLNLKRL